MSTCECCENSASVTVRERNLWIELCRPCADAWRRWQASEGRTAVALATDAARAMYDGALGRGLSEETARRLALDADQAIKAASRARLIATGMLAAHV